MEKILLFIPMFNCQAQIPRVIEKVCGSKVYDYLDEVLIVDNVSRDGSVNAAMEAIVMQNCVKCRIVQNLENVGLGGSHKTAFTYAIDNGFDYVIVLHGDDQGNINDFADVILAGMHRKVDAILGSRFMRGSILGGYSKFRVFGNSVFNAITSAFCRKQISDLGSGLNMYCVKSLSSKYFMKFPDNLIFNVFMLMGHTELRHAIRFVPISWREEDQTSNVKFIKQTTHMSMSLIRYLLFRTRYLFEVDHRTTEVNSYVFRDLFSFRNASAE